MPYYVKHVPDEHTALYYSFDDDELGNYTTLVDSSSGSRHFTIAGSPAFIIDTNNQPYARFFSTTSDVASRAGDVASTAMLLGEHTVEAWVRPTSLATYGSTVLAYMGDGETLATNVLTNLVITTAGKIQMFWEYGAGTNVIATSSLSNVTVNNWAHVATVKRDSGDHSTYYVDFYQDGALKNTVGPLTNASGGTSDGWYACNSPTATTDRFRGSIRSIHVSNIARDATYISSSAASSNRMHTEDANTFLHLKMIESDERVIDSGYLGLNLYNTGSLAATGSYSHITRANSLTTSTGKSKVFDRTFFASAFSNSSGLSSVLGGEYTIMSIVRKFDESAGYVFARKYDTSTTSDMMMSLRTMSGTVSYEWNVAGSVNTFEVTGSIIEDRGGVYHMALRKTTSPLPEYMNLDIFVDGVLVKSDTMFQTASLDTNGKFSVGGGWDLTETTVGHFYGLIDDFVIVDRAMTDEEIRAYVIDEQEQSSVVNVSKFNVGFN